MRFRRDVRVRNWQPSALALGFVAIAATAHCSKSDDTSHNNAAQVTDAGTPGTGDGAGAAEGSASSTDSVKAAAAVVIDEGRNTFRYETFGDEAYWGGTLGLHRAIEGAGHGGVGSGLTPRAALGLGLKLDADALPENVKASLSSGALDLDSPDTTLAALQLDAVVGVKGFFDEQKNLTSVGIRCALCHSTVDDALAPGVGHRLDGWPNRDLNVGAIVNLAPDLSVVATQLQVPEATVRQVLQSWGPGKFDAELILDGKAFRPDKQSAATLIPPAFGLAGVNLAMWTGFGSVTYWNAFVANLEMHGKGTFFDPRLDDPTKYPVSARTKVGHTETSPDLVTSKLAALHVYQLLLNAPTPPAGSFDAAAAERGKVTFSGQAKCASCHVPPLFTEPGWNMHTAAEIGIDDFQSSRAPDGRYRTSPLKGLFAHGKGGYYHDGRFATLLDVVNHYDTVQALGLTPAQKTELVEYLKSL